MSAPIGDEEQRDEGVAQRQESRQRLVRVVRAVDDEPREERAERERQPGGLGEGRRPEPDREGDEQEHLVAVHPGHPRHQRAG